MPRAVRREIAPGRDESLALLRFHEEACVDASSLHEFGVPDLNEVIANESRCVCQKRQATSSKIVPASLSAVGATCFLDEDVSVHGRDTSVAGQISHWPRLQEIEALVAQSVRIEYDSHDFSYGV